MKNLIVIAVAILAYEYAVNKQTPVQVYNKIKAML